MMGVLIEYNLIIKIIQERISEIKIKFKVINKVSEKREELK